MAYQNYEPLAGIARRDLMIAGVGAAAIAAGIGSAGTVLAQTAPAPAPPLAPAGTSIWNNEAACF